MVAHPKDGAPPAGRGQAPSASEEGGAEAGSRVAKALARAGVASRREVERLIEGGRVALNGKVLDTPAVKVSPGDILTVDGKPIEAAEPTRVWRYHKPAGLLTSHTDPQGRPTVFDNLPAGLPRVISVGRLDLNSEGLLLLTNDGGLARSLELPSGGLVRRYRARAFGRPDPARLEALKDGITIEGVAYGPIEAKIDKAHPTADRKTGSANLWISVALTEGKNREVRRVLEHLGLKVNRLIRLAYGPFALADLGQGEAQEVGPRVIREQLAEHVSPANLPKGDRAGPGPVVRAAGPAPGRRPKAAIGADGAPGKAASNSTGARAEEKPKKVYKAGWAKPAKRTGPNHGPKPAKPSKVAAPAAGFKPHAPAKAQPGDRPLSAAKAHAAKPRPSGSRAASAKPFAPKSSGPRAAFGGPPRPDGKPSGAPRPPSGRPKASRPGGTGHRGPKPSDGRR